MAKGKTGCLSEQWLENVWAAWLASALMIALCSANILRAADSIPSHSPSSNAITASLEYQETDYSIINWDVPLRTQTIPFKKEPEAASGRIVRGALNFGVDSSNSIPFVWQRGVGKIYLDLNRNQDLTDDVAGVFTFRGRTPASSQVFTNVHLTFDTPLGSRKLLANLMLYDLAPRPDCIAALRSFWQGKVSLQGEEWQVGVVETSIDRLGSPRNSYLLLRPWEARNRPFSTSAGALDALRFSQKLFVQNHAYQLECTNELLGNNVRLKLQFTEQQPALGELRIGGDFIQRAALEGGPWLAVFNRPEGVVKVPVGTYAQPKVWLKAGDAEAYRECHQITIAGMRPAVLVAGGPLTNSVSVSRRGTYLNLHYRLVGAAGDGYQLARQDRAQPPEFAIYRGDKRIASGKFEFG